MVKKTGIVILIVFISFSCVNQVSIDGFNSGKWISAVESCDEYRLKAVPALLENRDQILTSNQTEIERLLGKASEHELYNRNQKFFHYRLSPPNKCKEIKNPKYLSIRFNAIGRASEIQVVVRD